MKSTFRPMPESKKYLIKGVIESEKITDKRYKKFYRNTI
jgi:hypothetical protein